MYAWLAYHVGLKHDIGVYNYMYLIMYDSAQMQCYI